MATDVQRLEDVWKTRPGIVGWLMAVNHKQVGLRYIATAFLFFVAGGINALLMRTQLAQPESSFLSPETYNQLFTMHGTTMMFLFAVPMVEGLGSYLVPLMVGARDMAFPRLNAFGYWCFLFGGLLLYSSFLFDAVPDGGWFAYVPLTGPEFSPGSRIDFWLLGISLVEISGIIAAVELVVTILKLRAPGMSLNRMPLFAWAILAMGFAIIFGFPPLVVGSVMLEFDRSIGTFFFDPAVTGSALLWQHLFWTFGHPEVYIQFLPAVGVVSMIVPTFSQRPIAGYIYLALAAVAIGILSFGLWVHHMFAVGLPSIALSFFMAASITIAIPSGIQIFAWIATIWGGRPVWRTPFLFVIGFVLIFVIGGITGVMVALVPLDWQVHDSYFVVAHFHYVLIGGVVFPVFAAFYYWFPKVSGRMLSERLGQLNFWLFFTGFNLTFFLMHIVGLQGMPRRIYTYDADRGWGTLNLLETIGAFTIATSVLVFIINVIYSLLRGKEAGNNPWNAGSLEWSIPSPPPSYNFVTNPIVTSRDPVWDAGPPDAEPIVTEEPRFDRRETLGTTILDAVPEELIWVPKPTFMPLIAALGTTLAFIGALIKEPLVIAAGILAALVAFIFWTWPDEQERSERTRGETSHGIPFAGLGPRSVTSIGIALLIGVLGSGLLSLIASYFYLQSGVDEWPPDGIDVPGAIIPIAGVVFVIASMVAMVFARRAARELEAGPVRIWLAAAIILGLAFLGTLGLDLYQVDFEVDTNVYGSLYYLLAGFAGLMAAIGVIMAAVTLARTWQGDYWETANATVADVALFWWFILVTGLSVIAVLYASPHLI